jgi:hypothetical protein
MEFIRKVCPFFLTAAALTCMGFAFLPLFQIDAGASVELPIIGSIRLDADSARFSGLTTITGTEFAGETVRGNPLALSLMIIPAILFALGLISILKREHGFRFTMSALSLLGIFAVAVMLPRIVANKTIDTTIEYEVPIFGAIPVDVDMAVSYTSWWTALIALYSLCAAISIVCLFLPTKPQSAA